MYFPWTVKWATSTVVGGNNSNFDQLGTATARQLLPKKKRRDKEKKVALEMFDSDADADADADADSDGVDVDDAESKQPPLSPSPIPFVPLSLNQGPVQPSSSMGSKDDVPLQTDSPAVVMRRLIVCSVGLIVTFVTWGILQERMLTRRYPRVTGDRFTYTYFLVFTNRCWSLLFSTFLMYEHNLFKWPEGVTIQDLSYSAVSNMLSSWCQYEALKWVSFPAQTLFKSFKLMPVMLMGKVRRRLGGCSYFIILFCSV